MSHGGVRDGGVRKKIEFVRVMHNITPSSMSKVAVFTMMQVFFMSTGLMSTSIA